MTAAAATYRATSIKRERRTPARMEQLDRQIMDVLEADHPQSVRHVFYRITDPRLPEPVEKSERGYRHVQDRIAKLRRAGLLPYGWITDATRRGHHTPTYDSEGAFLRAAAPHYRADPWRDADCYVEVWAESRSIAGVIERDCRELAVSLYPAGGFASITLAYEAAEAMRDIAQERAVVVFYIGDYDPAGVLIDRAIERELRRHLGAPADMTFQRLGITEAQIESYGLPTKPRKAGDRRALHVQATVEAEAMPAHILRGLLRGAIEHLLPPQAMDRARREEEAARGYFDRLAAQAEGAP